MSRLEAIIEQTVFLVEKQKEAQRDCSMLFHDLLQAAQKKCEATAIDHKDREGLEYICDLVTEQAERIDEEAQGEIDFLEEQLEALQRIGAIKDPNMSEEMLSEILDTDVQVKDSDEFKKEVTEESLAARHNLAIVINDMKAALSEGNVDDLVTYLETILETEDDEDCEDCMGCDDSDDDEDEDDEEFEEVVDECCCSGKKKPEQSSCCGSKSKNKCCK